MRCLTHRVHCRLECPAGAWQGFYSYHFPCARSFPEKLALLDMFQAAQNLLAVPAPASRHAGAAVNATHAAHLPARRARAVRL